MQIQTLITVLGLTGSMANAALSSPPSNLRMPPRAVLAKGMYPRASNSTGGADCEPLKCLEIVAAVGCIGFAIAADKFESVLSCVASNTDKLCNCAGCISELGNFLDKEGVCV